MKSKLSRLLREPLFHFLLLGAALFGVYRYLPPQGPTQPAAQAAEPAAAASRQILLSLDQLTRLALAFQANWGREPTAQELNLMVENDVKEEILYREGLALGLDKDDEIVRRRMAQKMQFLAEDVAAQHAPSDSELRVFFDQNKKLFEEPTRLGFRHLYFSPDRRASDARADAERALSEIKGEAEEVKFASADPFMFQDYYRDKAPDYLRKEFGPAFAAAIMKLPRGSWQGPIESGFGWHLVFVDTLIPARASAFEEIEPDVKQAWLAEQKAKAVKQAYDEMRAKYTILLPAPPPEGAPLPKTDAKAAAMQSIPSGLAPE
ncbi:MAG TPA: peptidylprolyl isomerase [Roseiarcus sp.]|nr:peptidylprolyl isomerase [Roseiarcus sp.]